MDVDSNAPLDSYARAEYKKGDHVYYRDGGRIRCLTSTNPLQGLIANAQLILGNWHPGEVEGPAGSSNNLYTVIIEPFKRPPADQPLTLV